MEAICCSEMSIDFQHTALYLKIKLLRQKKVHSETKLIKGSI
jgi:hypothetical protein